MGIFGTLLGGVIADCLAKRLGYHGRPLNVTWFHGSFHLWFVRILENST